MCECVRERDKSVTAIYVGVNGQVVRSSDVSARVPGPGGTLFSVNVLFKRP